MCESLLNRSGISETLVCIRLDKDLAGERWRGEAIDSIVDVRSFSRLLRGCVGWFGSATTAPLAGDTLRHGETPWKAIKKMGKYQTRLGKLVWVDKKYIWCKTHQSRPIAI